MFIAPNWFIGLLMSIGYRGIPLIIVILISLFLFYKIGTSKGDVSKLLIISVIVLFVGLPLSFASGDYLWYHEVELPSVNEKNITVADWQPRPNTHANKNGMMVISSADQLMLVTSTGEAYLNTEDFWFQKFNTRDIFNELKVNGTYTIKYYGWREGYNNGFPNILNVEKVIDESNATNNNYNTYFGSKLAIN